VVKLGLAIFVVSITTMEGSNMRKYLAECLDKYLKLIDDFEKTRKDYLMDSSAYRNLSGNIFHCEGRVEQIQETLQHLDKKEK
jgi:hypothetical protein